MLQENSLPNQIPHSAAYFGDFRDFWWNRDFLELMARRLHFENIHSVLDVGCGIGHWGRCLDSVLPADATVLGIDREEAWIKECKKRLTAQELSAGRFEYRVGDINALPFADNTFDLATCQTVLIHIENPLLAVGEMLRVTKPGGLVLAVEPNNRIGMLVGNNLSLDNPTEETLKYVRFYLICERGKRLLGLGDISLGDILPGLLSAAGAKDIQVYLSDKTSAVFPPYTGNEQQTLLAQAREMKEKQMWIWDRGESEKYFLAGGGNAAEFPELWAFVTQSDDEFENAVASGKYYTSGGAMMYLVSGRKPDPLTKLQ